MYSVLGNFLNLRCVLSTVSTPIHPYHFAISRGGNHIQHPILGSWWGRHGRHELEDEFRRKDLPKTFRETSQFSRLLCNLKIRITTFRNTYFSPPTRIIPKSSLKKSIADADISFTHKSGVLKLISFSHEVTTIMGKKGVGGYYAVARGRTVGLYNTWDECKAQVQGFPNARYKKFSASEEAQAFIEEHRDSTNKITVASASSEGSATEKKTAFNKTSTVGSIQSGLHVGKPLHSAQKRDFSSLKVTDDRVINKRAKIDQRAANTGVDLSNFSTDEDGYVIVYTDGACAKNGRKAAKAGIGVWFGENHSLNISEPVEGRQTNNTAEIQAAERAIIQAKQNCINKLTIKTDSQFTINCVTKWLNNWKMKNWRLSSGGDVKNKEDLIKLDEAMKNMEIKWSYVAGHAGIEGNEAADRLAVAGAERSK